MFGNTKKTDERDPVMDIAAEIQRHIEAMA
jgi:hypothetical protein